jgi:hypothetical protein
MVWSRVRRWTLVRRTKNMAAIYCTRCANSGRRLAPELEGLEANITGRSGLDEQHRIDRGKGEWVGDRRSPGPRPPGAFYGRAGPIAWQVD